MWPWDVNMATQNLLRFLLLLMLMLRIMLATACWFGSWRAQSLNKSFALEPNVSSQICNKLLPTLSLASTSATETASTSFELASSHARVTSIKFTKRYGVSQLVSEWVSFCFRTFPFHNLIDMPKKILSDPSPIIGNACQWLTDSLTP